MICLISGGILAGCGANVPAGLSVTDPAAMAEDAVVIEEEQEPEQEKKNAKKDLAADENDADNNMENGPVEGGDELDLKDILIGETGAADDEIAVFAEDDFDNDGAKEAFSLVGEVMEEYDDRKVIEGTVWFVNEDGCRKLHEPQGMGMFDEVLYMTFGDTTYVMFDEMYATALVTYVWTVSDGEAAEAPFSALGEVITDTSDGEDQFRIMDSSYDGMFNPETSSYMGHTWKHYYFFYNDQDDKVYEYGGTEINRENVVFLCGRDLVGELIPERDQITGIFCRGNGLIVINYEHIADGCAMNYHYIYDFTKGYFVDDMGLETGEEPLDGICKEALCPEIANYPSVPGPDDQF